MIDKVSARDQRTLRGKNFINISQFWRVAINASARQT